MNLDYLMSVVAGLRDRLDAMPLFRWATVVGTKPLRVQLDGDTTPLSADPVNLAGDRVRGERVWTVSVDRRLYILGAPDVTHASTPTHASSFVPVGTIVAHAGVAIPEDWLPCDGTTYRVGDYPALAAALGVTGAGSEFTVPDLRGGGEAHTNLRGVGWIIKT